MAGITLNTKIEQLYKLLENCKLYLVPSDSQRQSDVIIQLRHLYDLIKLPTVKHHSTFPRLLATAINHLLAFCGSRDQAVRLAASDVLNKTIKALQQDHMSKVIGELFQEIKKVRALNYGMIVSSYGPVIIVMHYLLLYANICQLGYLLSSIEAVCSRTCDP